MNEENSAPIPSVVSGNKDDFLAIMSHELRTPLNGIVGMISMLSDAGPLTPKQSEYLGILSECSLQLMNLLNNVLDISKLMSSRMNLLSEPFSLREVISRASSIIEEKIISKNLYYSVTIDQNVPLRFSGDESRLIQILTNILGNSVKFTDKGFVKLNVSSIIFEEIDLIKKHKVTFEIQDSGIGIPKNEQESVFKMFTRGTNVQLNNGNGLGLAISKEFVKLMGGKISVKSEGSNGKGSLFSFFVILEEELSLEDLKEQYSKYLTNSNVLIVDDRIEFRIQLIDLVLRWKAIPVAVSSAREALVYLKKMDFSIALIDICMPDLTGVDLVLEIKKDEKCKNMCLIALSSIGNVSGSQFFDAYLSKPIDSNKIFSSIVNCLIKKNSFIPENKPISLQVSSPSNPEKNTKKTKETITILIAEDDGNNLYTLREMLLNYGIKESNIFSAKNGEEAYLLMTKNSRPRVGDFGNSKPRSYSATTQNSPILKSILKTPVFDIAFLDIFMPVLDGFQLAEKVSILPKKPLLIATSASIQSSDKKKCQDLGFGGYLTKPILKEKLHVIISSLIIES